MNKVIYHTSKLETAQKSNFFNKLMFLVIAFFMPFTTILQSVLRQTKKSNLAVLVFTLFTSILSAQGEFKVNVDISAGAFTLVGALPTSGVDITVYDQADLGGAPLLSLTGVNAATAISQANFTNPSIDNVQIWYSNNITRVNFNDNDNAQRVQSIVAWGSATFTLLNFFDAINLDIDPAAGAPTIGPNANFLRLFRRCTNLVDAGNTLATWDTSNVTNMQEAFYNADALVAPGLGSWNVGNVTNFNNTFGLTALFNDPTIANWNIGENTGTSAINMAALFNDALAFNQDLNGWERAAGTLSGADPGSTMAFVSNMTSMFQNADAFNGAIGAWDVGRVTSFNQMFYRSANPTAFNNGDASGVLGTGMQNWNIGENLAAGATINMSRMFRESDHFNQDLSNWDVSKVTVFTETFLNTNLFTGAGLNTWKIGGANTNPINMGSMFSGAVVFNEPLAGWENNADSTMAFVSNMASMFLNADIFNQPLNSWDVGRVTSFSQMFWSANIFNNGDAANAGIDEVLGIGIGLRNWNIAENLDPTDTISMFRMFRENLEFNQDLSNWDVTQVTNFQEMFWTCTDFTGDGGVELASGSETLTSGLSNWKIGGTNTNAINMQNMFGVARVFNEPLASWETPTGSTMAYVTNTSNMFNGALIFNQPLGDWDVGRVTNFGAMFQSTNAFADPTPSINTWNISENTGTTAIQMHQMFNNANAFNSPLESWQTNADATMEYVTRLDTMFANADLFNQDLSAWDVGRVTNFNQMFYRSTGVTAYNNGDASGFIGTNLQNWNIGENLTGTQTINMHRMFRDAERFNQDLTGWDVTKVNSFQEMFFGCGLYEGIGLPTWKISGSNTHAVTMRSMLGATPVFNQPLNTWETDPGSTMAYVTDIAGMFSSATAFNQSLGDWDVGRVRDFFVTFTNARAFEDIAPSINNWNISENTGTATINMERTFENAEVFNSSLAGWETNANSTMIYVNRMDEMFNSADTFNQSLAAWTPTRCTNFASMLNNSGLSVANYDATLTSWAQQDLVDNQNLGAVNLEFCAAEPFRASLVADQGWTISGDILGCSPGGVSGAGSLLYWVTAGSHIGADGDAVTEWKDISGDGRSFTQATATNQPTFLNNTTDMVNYNPIMKFDGADDFIAGYDFNLHDLSFPNTPRIDLPIVGRTASSELTITRGIDPDEFDITFSTARSVLGGQFNGNSTTAGSWRPATEPTPGSNTTEYLELDLGEIVPLSTIRTQGEGSNQEAAFWVETYTVEISTDGITFTQLDGTFTGNVDKGSVVLNEFSENTAARHVRIFPQTWVGYPALRVGVGTKGYNAASTFMVAIEDVRQDNTTQSLNHIDDNNRLDISVVNGAGNTTLTNSFLGDNSIDVSAAAPALNSEPFLINYTITGNGEARLYRDGVELATDATTPRYLLLGQTHLGGLPTNNYFNGKIAETNLFAIEPSQEERERINTYFALKYNIPIPHNFIYEDENAVVQTIWDQTTNAAYNHNVFGLGLDGNQGLNQRVSSARDDDSILIAATTNNFTALNSDPTRAALTGESAFVIMGNDDAETTFSPNGAPNKFHVLDRKWFAQVTGDSQNLFLEFNVGNTNFDVDTPPQTTDYFFIKDDNSNGDLSDDTPILMTNTSGELWSTPEAVTVADGQLFTLATSFIPNPGGVATDLALWLRADGGIDETDGQAVDIWEDQSITSNHATETTNQPDFRNNATDNYNFNPVISFNGINDRLIGGSLDLSSNSTFLMVSNGSGAAGTSAELSSRTTSNNGFFLNQIEQNFLWSIPGGVAPFTGSTIISSDQHTLQTLSSNSSGHNFYHNGLLDGTSTANGSNMGTLPYRVANDVPNNSYFNGSIAEIINYSNDISSTEKQQIESYLALKYGITLDQTAPTDYISSGTTPTLMWDSAIDANYNTDIFGIGRDDAGGLNQRVSKSVNPNTVLTVSLDGDDFTKTNAALVNGNTTNLQFLTFASNGLEANNQITELDEANYNLGIEREWQVYKTANFTDAVNFKFEGFGGYDVIQSTDNDFSTDGDQTVLGTLDENGELTDVTGLVSGSYLTLARFQNAPGGVVLSLGLWLKANDGVTETISQVTEWDDQSNNSDITSQASIAASDDVILNTTALNFNPTVEFTGANNKSLKASLANNNLFNGEVSIYSVVIPQEVNASIEGIIGTSSKGLMVTTGDYATDAFGNVGARTHATVGVPTLVGAVYTQNSLSGSRTYVDGEFKEQSAFGTVSGLGNFFEVGGRTQNGTANTDRIFDGEIAEAIVYDGDQATGSSDRQKIQSYLALKYGITLDASITDYVNTDGVSVYNLASYNNDVFGIANEALQALNQEISKSVNTGAILTISTDTDFTVANGLHTPLNDGQYLVIGNDGASGSIPASQNTTDLDTDKYFNRVAREWKSVNTGTVGAVNLQFDGFDANWVVLTRTTDGDFSATSGTTETQLSATGSVALTLPATSYFTLAQKPIAIEFETATASDVEANGSNLPNLLIDGELIADATIDVLVNAAGTATANTDYVLGSALGDGAVTIAVTIPAGTYSAANPLPLAADIPLHVNYASQINPGIFPQETFVPTQTGDYVLTHSAALVTSGTGWVNVGTTLVNNTGADDILDGLNGDRVDATNLVRTHTISLVAGTTYYLTSGAGGNGNLTDVNINIRQSNGLTFTITDDAIVENNETISLSLSNPQNGLEVNNVTGAEVVDTHVYTITDDDTATVTIAADADAIETTSARAFTVIMSKAAAIDIAINYTLTGTAANTDDYSDGTTVTGTVTIPAGSTSATIDITVVNDTNAELTETIIATLTAATNITAVTANITPATLNITDDDLAALSISIGSPFDATEGTSDITYTVSLDNNLTNETGTAITGTLALMGTATNGTDYTDVTSFSIADGAATATITVSVTDDSEVEISETVIATISSPSVGSIGTAAATANITDDDLAALTISIGSPVDATEGASDITYTVSLDNGVTNETGTAITGTLALTGTATNGTDYTDVTSFSIADGSASATLTVSVTDDSEVEISETVIATISNASVGSIGTAVATANITDDDAAALTISIGSPVDATEGASDITYTVSLDNGVTNETGTAITGTLALTGTATNGTDYTDVTSFSIADGSASATITVSVTDDSEVEISETVIATISNASVGSIGTAVATANILDDDAAALTISIGSPVDATEGTSDITYTVSLDNNLTNETGTAITGTLALMGTATNGTDYTDVTSFSIADGSASATLTVSVTDDSEVEISETVIATISNASVGSIGTAVATANILDDDAAALTISIGSPVDATEGASDITYTVSLDNGVTNETGTAITGTLALTGTATNGTDYTDVTSFSIADGSASATLTVSVTDDSEVEISETVIATISNASVGSIGTAVATANITDDDLAAVSISISSPVDAIEGTNDVSYIVSLDDGLTNNTGTAITGNITLTGTATNGTDYTDVTSFSLADGSASATITVSVTDDSEIEFSETIIATISTPNVGAINNASATAIILDNDTATITIVADANADESISSRAFTLTMSKAALTDVTVDYVLSGSALNPDDYTDVSPVIGTITIPTGATIATINLEVVNDNFVESDETISATLSAETNNTVVTTSTVPATLTILNDDEIIVSVIEDITTDESVEEREFLVALDDVAAVDVVLEYTFSGTAKILDDYTDLSGGSITIPAGTTVASIRINIIDDLLEEDDEEITISLSSQMNEISFVNTSATLTIIDNDECILNCDTDGDGDCDFNCDCDDDGIADGDSCGQVGSISSVIVATAFTPNGDGINDTWVIDGIENHPNSVAKVYNRWGHEVFLANGYQNNWNATYKDNSRKLPQGSYYYIVSLGDGGGTQTGWIFINY